MKNEAPAEPVTGATFVADKAERTVFIGTFVRPEIKEHLKRVGSQAPGGTRNLSWAINQILERELAANGQKETNDNDKTD